MPTFANPPTIFCVFFVDALRRPHLGMAAHAQVEDKKDKKDNSFFFIQKTSCSRPHAFFKKQ
jgi:hypothetical protein